MNNTLNTTDGFCRFVNRQLTSKLIKLHDSGYELDFSVFKGSCLLCTQDQQCFSEDSITVKVVDQEYDFITRSYKYLHTVETACGRKGILLIEGIYGYYSRFNPVNQPVPLLVAISA